MPKRAQATKTASGSCLVTVGTTKFDALICHLERNATSFRKLLESRGIRRLVVQIGRTALPPPKGLLDLGDGKFSVECFRLSSEFRSILEASTLVISHAGAGSITETLRLGIPMLVVVNETLMDNHQQELATAMARHGYLHWTRVDDVLTALEDNDFDTLKPYPKPELVRFGKFVDRRMGFAARAASEDKKR